MSEGTESQHRPSLFGVQMLNWINHADIVLAFPENIRTQA
jgi:hypothetical protein